MSLRIERPQYGPLSELETLYERINSAVDVGPACVPQYYITINDILHRMDVSIRLHFVQVPCPGIAQPTQDWSVERCRRFFVIVSESIETGLRSLRRVKGHPQPWANPYRAPRAAQQSHLSA